MPVLMSFRISVKRFLARWAADQKTSFLQGVMEDKINKLLSFGLDYDQIENILREEDGVDIDLYTCKEGL